MTLIDLGVPLVGLLAFIGWVTCLRHWVWLTLVGTGAFAVFAYDLHPYGPETQLYWVAAGAGFVFAALIIWAIGPHDAGVEVSAKPAGKDQIVLDGTNILHWDGDGAQMATLRVVVSALKKRDLVPVIFLDASTRHHLGDKSLNERGFAKALGVKVSQVMVCPAGTEADAFLLKYARSEGLSVVSNDRFRDRAQQTKGIKIIKGVIANGRPIFEGF